MKVIVYKNKQVAVFDNGLMLEYSNNPIEEVYAVNEGKSKLDKKIKERFLKKSDIDTLKKEGKIT
jgi:hypothetical protein